MVYMTHSIQGGSGRSSPRTAKFFATLSMSKFRSGSFTSNEYDYQNHMHNQNWRRRPTAKRDWLSPLCGKCRKPPMTELRADHMCNRPLSPIFARMRSCSWYSLR